MKELSRAAIELAEAGWKVFPVDAGSKRPKTTHGHLDATNDPEHVRRWHNLFDAHGAIATPTGDGLLVIDVDPRHGGRIPPWAPETLTVKTQHDGYHLYYVVDEDITSRAGLFGQGVDSKSKGGYVLVPPSPGYRWVNVRPKARLLAADLRLHFVEGSSPSGGSAWRLPPNEWYRGIIHDQVVAWAAYFAGQLEDPDDVTRAVWAMVEQARKGGVPIDNARDHIGSAIRWVLRREANATRVQGPSLD